MNLEDIYNTVCYIITGKYNWNLSMALLWHNCASDSADTLAVPVQDSNWLGK